MRCFVVFVVALALALAAFGALAQPEPASAQVNCRVYGDNYYNNTGSTVTYSYRLVINSTNTVVGGPIDVEIPNGESRPVYIPLNGPFSGMVTVQRNQGSGWNDYITHIPVNCGNDAEIAAPCDQVGADIGLPRDVDSAGGFQDTTYTLKIFKNGNPFSTKTIVVGGGALPYVHMHEEVITTLPPDHNDVYTYEVTCGPGNTHGCQNNNPPAFGDNALVTRGTFARRCSPPCGPSLEGRPLGLMTASVPFHWAPQEGAASTFIAEAGKTFKVLRTSGGFTEVVLACQAYWVPSSAIQIIGN